MAIPLLYYSVYDCKYQSRVGAPIHHRQSVCSWEVKDTLVSLQWITQLFHPEWHVCDYSRTKKKDMGLLQSEENKGWSNDSLSAPLSKSGSVHIWQAQQQAHRPEQRGPSGSVLEWEALFCHSEGATFRRKTNPVKDSHSEKWERTEIMAKILLCLCFLDSNLTSWWWMWKATLWRSHPEAGYAINWVKAKLSYVRC